MKNTRKYFNRLRSIFAPVFLGFYPVSINIFQEQLSHWAGQQKKDILSRDNTWKYVNSENKIKSIFNFFFEINIERSQYIFNRIFCFDWSLTIFSLFCQLKNCRIANKALFASFSPLIYVYLKYVIERDLIIWCFTVGNVGSLQGCQSTSNLAWATICNDSVMGWIYVAYFKRSRKVSFKIPIFKR